MKRTIPVEFFKTVYGEPVVGASVTYGGRDYEVVEVNDRTVILED